MPVFIYYSLFRIKRYEIICPKIYFFYSNLEHEKLLVLVLDVHLIPFENFPMLRMCRPLIPTDDERDDVAIIESLPVSIDLLFIIFKKPQLAIMSFPVLIY